MSSSEDCPETTVAVEQPRVKRTRNKVTCTRKEYLKDYMKNYYKINPEKFAPKIETCKICNRKYEVGHIKRHNDSKCHRVCVKKVEEVPQ